MNIETKSLLARDSSLRAAVRKLCVGERMNVEAALEEAIRRLATVFSRMPFDSDIAVGAMIETPSAALLAGRLADEVDFFSVGTNDLVQYLLAADRLGNATDSAYDPLHPAVLQTLASLAAVAGENGKSISLCGEMAGDPLYTALLLGLGFRQFSVNPGRLLEIKHAIRSIRISEAKELACAALAADSVAEIRARVQDDWSRRRPVSPPDLPVAAG